MDPQVLAAAAKELAAPTDKAASENKALAGRLPGELGQACSAGQLTPEQMRQLAKLLGECSGRDLGTLQRLCQARLIDTAMLSRCRGSCQGDPNALAACLCAARAEDCSSGLPGRGGVNRGRGEAAMTWSEGTSANDVEFKETPLSPGDIDSLKESALAGVSAASPEGATPGGESTGGALDTSAAGPGSAHRHTILPQHRRAVQRYFERSSD